MGPGFDLLATSEDAPLVRNTGIDIGGYEAPLMIAAAQLVSFCLR